MPVFPNNLLFNRLKPAQSVRSCISSFDRINERKYCFLLWYVIILGRHFYTFKRIFASFQFVIMRKNPTSRVESKQYFRVVRASVVYLRTRVIRKRITGKTRLCKQFYVGTHLSRFARKGAFIPSSHGHF